MRFAEFCGVVLQSTRATAGASAQFVTGAMAAQLSANARISIGRLENAWRNYVRRVPQRPEFGARVQDIADDNVRRRRVTEEREALLKRVGGE